MSYFEDHGCLIEMYSTMENRIICNCQGWTMLQVSANVGKWYGQQQHQQHKQQ